ncbi:MAG: hypothetical protein KC431_29515, partial [Myxococcales bacterium]|nr:hypothetical protein [Myxococcales bacterium]
MKTPRAIPSLLALFLLGLGLAACEEETVEESPEGRSCQLLNQSVSCGDSELLSYCGYQEYADAQNGFGALTQGPCISPDENECMPGDSRTEPSADPDDLCGGTHYSCDVVGGEPMWVEQLCNTPLVLRFDDAPIEMIAAEATPMATFDIDMTADSCITTDWPTAATPWLVLDRDHSGSIDGGHELFGSGTQLASGRHATHGFAALAEFDQNGDERVDGLDARFGELMLWRDWDADRVSTPDELTPLSDSGVDGLPVDFEVAVECDERGNCG